jgi:hypothetical protein
VLANPGAEHRAFTDFVTPTIATPNAGTSAAKPGRRPPPPPATNLFADVSGGKAQAAALGNIGIPVYFPRMLGTGSSYCSGTIGNCPAEAPTVGTYPRAYLIHDPAGATHVSYRLTVGLNPSQGEYYGVQGTAWKNPPILNSPTQTRTVAGKQLLEYFNGRKLSLVAWRTPQAVYWISNTLTDTLSNSQMVGIAASLTRA